MVGYLIMSKTTRFPEDGYRVGPFFADSAAIARSLLKVAVGFASTIESSHIFLDVAADLNPEAVSIFETELGAKSTFEFVFMASKEPSKLHCKMFALASIEVM